MAMDTVDSAATCTAADAMRYWTHKSVGRFGHAWFVAKFCMPKIRQRKVGQKICHRFVKLNKRKKLVSFLANQMT